MIMSFFYFTRFPHFLCERQLVYNFPGRSFLPVSARAVIIHNLLKHGELSPPARPVDNLLTD